MQGICAGYHRLLVAILLTICCNTGVSATSAELPSTSNECPTERMRTCLERLWQVMRSDHLSEEAGIEAFFKEFGHLYVIAQREPALFVRELNQFLAKTKDERAIGLWMRLLQLVEVPIPDKLDAILPDLDSPNTVLQWAARKTLDQIVVGGNQFPDFSYFGSHIERCINLNQEVEPALITYMYSLDPKSALLTLLEAHEKDRELQKPIRWAEKTVSDYRWKRQYGFLGRAEIDPNASEQLIMLSQRPEWWARMYVAYIFRDQRELRSKEVVRRLCEDVHPLVKQAMSNLQPPAK